MLAWMIGAVQGGQGEALRRQGEFQVAIAEMLRQMRVDNAKLWEAQLARLEGIEHALADLRAEIRRQEPSSVGHEPLAVSHRPSAVGHRPSAVGHRSSAIGHQPSVIGHRPSAIPPVTPLQVPRAVPEPRPQASTAWLLDRVSRLEDENRSAWNDLLSRFAPPVRRAR
jgi:hypothetical protein